MERLTFRHETPYSKFNGTAEPCEPIHCADEYSKKALDSILERLATYEDTGLEPEEIKDAFDDSAALKLAAKALSKSSGRIRELAQADKDGRPVVLPPERRKRND